jgi:hypothetical protein
MPDVLELYDGFRVDPPAVERDLRVALADAGREGALKSAGGEEGVQGVGGLAHSAASCHRSACCRVRQHRLGVLRRLQWQYGR